MPKRSCRFSLVLFVLLSFLVSSPAFAVVVSIQPPLGTFQMRPELAGQHPRLFFTAADLPELRRKAANEASFFVQAARTSFRSYIGRTMPAVPEDWKQYLYGNWALVSFDMMAVLQDDAAAAATAHDWAMALSEATWWIKDDLAPMDTLAGLAITYDILYDRFTEAERAQLRTAIYNGMTFISNQFFISQYYTQDYQNNHMHNRLQAQALAAWAIYGDDPALDVQPYADLAIQQVHNLLAWLPDDGSCHEGPGYWSFGHHWIVKAVHAAEHLTGENLVASNPHLTSSHLFRLYMTAPGWDSTLNIGDAGEGELGNITGMVRSISESGDQASQGILQDFMAHDAGRFYQHPIWGVLWYDGDLPASSIDDLPLGIFWPDLEMFSVRSSWDNDAVAFVFKCGPVGGHKMQQLRNGAYVNVAHDHPDQNHFLLYAYGQMLAADDGYPRIQKLTSNHNTITVDGQGQPREGSGWQQPFDYSQTGRMLDCFVAGNSAFSTGDASPCYEEASRFHRHAFFVDGRYVVLYDDLIGYGARDRTFQWRLHNNGTWQTLSPTHFTSTMGNAMLDVNFLNSGAMTYEFLPAVETAYPCLAVTQNAQSAQFLSVLVPRKTGMTPLTSQSIGSANVVAVQVDGDGGRDIIAVPVSAYGPGQPDFFFAGNLIGMATAANICTTDGQTKSFMLVRGNMLAYQGQTLAQASALVNLARRAEGNGTVIEIAPPYKANAPGMVNVVLGGFQAGEEYTMTLDGVSAGSVVVDAQGAITLDVNVDGPRTIVIETPTLVAEAGDDQTLIDANGDGYEVAMLQASAPVALYPPLSYMWTNAQGGVVGVGEQTIAVLPVGENVVTLTIFDDNGGVATDTVTITVNSSVVEGDCTGDGHVNIDDFIILKQNYNTASGATLSEGDFNGDGAVDIDDFIILKQNYNK